MKSNLYKSSRTVALGKVDTSVSGSPDKPKSEISDSTVIINLAMDSVMLCAQELYHKKETDFSGPEDFKELVIDISYKINKNLIKGVVNPYRTHEISNPEYGCPLNEVEPLMELFYSWGSDIFNSNLSCEDVFQNCALIEKTLDKNIHPLKDGCGRLAKLLSMFLSMRNDAPVKVYPTQKEYHSAKGQILHGQDMFDPALSKGFISFYKSLPNFEI